MNQLLASGFLLVNNADAITNFINQVFEGSKIDAINKPLPHIFISISEGCRLLLINKKDCNSQQLSYIQSLSVSHVSITTSKSIDDIQKNTIQAGGRIIENKTDSSYCLFEGPEGIVFFITNQNSQKLCFQDIILSSFTDSSSVTVESQTIPVTARRAKVPTLPPLIRAIPTLDAQLFSNGKFITMTPNSREPVPFDTGVFKGHAMLVVRTALIDPRFAMFFEGRRYLICLYIILL